MIFLSNANECQRIIFEQLEKMNIKVTQANGNNNCPIILTSIMASRSGTDIEKTLQEANLYGNLHLYDCRKKFSKRGRGQNFSREISPTNWR